jgi:hypothetical protein
VLPRARRRQVDVHAQRSSGEPHATATQYIYVDGLSALWDDIKDRVTAEWGPEEMPYGLKEFAIKDPDGYLLSFGEELDKDGKSS